MYQHEKKIDQEKHFRNIKKIIVEENNPYNSFETFALKFKIF